MGKLKRPPAHAFLTLAAALLFCTTTHASDYGCTVLLCLANPIANGGPKGVAECVGPINQLYNDLAHGRVFPTCNLTDGNDGSSYALTTLNYFDPCPAGTVAAAPGTAVAAGSITSVTQGGKTFSGVQVTGEPTLSEAQGTDDHGMSQPSAQACVGTAIARYTRGDVDNGGTTYTVYHKVVWQTPQSPRAIDVIIDRTFYQRVHW